MVVGLLRIRYTYIYNTLMVLYTDSFENSLAIYMKGCLSSTFVFLKEIIWNEGVIYEECLQQCYS